MKSKDSQEDLDSFHSFLAEILWDAYEKGRNELRSQQKAKLGKVRDD